MIYGRHGWICGSPWAVDLAERTLLLSGWESPRRKGGPSNSNGEVGVNFGRARGTRHGSLCFVLLVNVEKGTHGHLSDESNNM